MNATLNQYYDGLECDFKIHLSTSTRATTSRPSAPIYRRRRGKAPSQFNGIHRRRRKKIRW